MFIRHRSLVRNCLLATLTLFAAANFAQGAPADSASAEAKAAEATGTADLRPVFENFGLPPRTQGGRPTCSVFTMTGAMEYAMAAHEAKGTRLSVEYLNWAKNIALISTKDGGKFDDIWKGFLESGICPDADMPYRSQYDWKDGPSLAARAFAKKLAKSDYRLQWIKTWDASTGITEEQFQQIKQVLRNQWPVCGGFRWPKDAQWKEGVLQMAPPEGVFDGHSVLLIGYKDDPSLPGGGAFILRNSNNHRDDHLMCYEYARAYLNDALWIETDRAPAPPATTAATQPH